MLINNDMCNLVEASNAAWKYSHLKSGKQKKSETLQR